MPQDANIERVNRLFDDWYGVLVNYALRLAGRLELAEEVVQEAFYLLYRELAAGKKIAHERAWTFCVVRREIRRQVYRHRLREISLESTEIAQGSTPAARISPDGMDDLADLLSVLSPREEEVMLLSMEALKYREIGVALGISPNTVATMHRRAIHKLRAVMGLEIGFAKPRKEAKVFRHTATTKTS